MTFGPHAPARASAWPALVVSGLMALSLAGCGGSDSSVVADQLPNTPGGWTKFVPKAAMVDGVMLTPTCSKAPGTKADFHFWARRGTVNKLVVFFEGGGACWDNGTCSFPIHVGAPAGAPGLYKAEILPTDNPTAYTGTFDLNDARNPVKDWSQVYVPYCTGDIHAGSKTTSYTNVATGQAFQIEHRGADNFNLILRWMRDSFDRPDQLLVTGSSAGAYGATTHFPSVRAAWPAAKAAMLADAGQGVTPASFDALRNANWNYQLSGSVYGSNPQATASSDIVKGLADKYPGDRFGQYTTATDLVQIQFYDVMVNGLTGVQGTSCKAWTDGMLAGLANNQRAANFRSYLAAGTTHTVLRGTNPDAAGVPLFVREASAGVGFTNWMSAMLSNDGAGWDNKACTNCTTFPVACPF